MEKFPGKGGWTYVLLPKIKVETSMPFNWVIADGEIDGYLLTKYKLMPMGNNQHFLPVKAAIRKKIKKESGDQVYVKLKLHELPKEIPEELKACFENEPATTWQNFQAKSKMERDFQVNWIYSAKTEEQKADRIIQLIENCS